MPKTSSAPSSAPSPFADITPLLDHFPTAPALLAETDIVAKLDRYSVKAGPLLPLLMQLQRWQKNITVLHHPCVCLFASHYATPVEAATQTQTMITALQNDHHPLKQVTSALNADLRVYEMDLAQTKRSAAQAAQAMTYGMLSIDDKSDVIILASISDGAEHAAAEITVPVDMSADDMLHELVPHMGLDFFAALGAALAARLAKQPMIVCGAFGRLLEQVLESLSPQAVEHVTCSVTDLVTQDMPPVFAAMQNLQQMRFLFSFMPAQHVRIV